MESVKGLKKYIKDDFDKLFKSEIEETKTLKQTALQAIIFSVLSSLLLLVILYTMPNIVIDITNTIYNIINVEKITPLLLSIIILPFLLVFNLFLSMAKYNSKLNKNNVRIKYDK